MCCIFISKIMMINSGWNEVHSPLSVSSDRQIFRITGSANGITTTIDNLLLSIGIAHRVSPHK